jgi:hypothetical protein
LVDNEYGIVFNSDGNILERKNAGWCGTPPLIYNDFNGTWEIKDPTIKIHVAYWGGMADYSWKIITIDNNELNIVPIESIYHPNN